VISIQRSNSETLTTYTLISLLSHAVVYAFLIHSVPGYCDGWRYLTHLSTFGLCAFCFAPLMGILSDLTENCHLSAQLGVILQLCGILFPYEWKGDLMELPVTVTIKMVLLGLGFGLFHVSSATTVLRRDSGKSGPIGLLLAPGSLGLCAALIFPKIGFYALPVLTLCAALPDGCKAYGLSLPRNPKRRNPLLMILAATACLLVLWLNQAQLPTLDGIDRKDKRALLLLALALAGGKAVGGYLCDLIGPGALILLPLGGYLLGQESTLIAAAAVAMLATAQPILIRLIADTMPRTPGLAYGLSTVPIFLMAWLKTRQSALLPSLPSPLLCAVFAALAALCTMLILRKMGALPTLIGNAVAAKMTRSKATAPGEEEIAEGAIEEGSIEEETAERIDVEPTEQALPEHREHPTDDREEEQS